MKHLTIAHKLFALVIAMAMMVAWLTHFMVARLHEDAYQTRQDLLRSQVESAMGVLQRFHEFELSGEMTREEAQNLAFQTIVSMRYEPNGYLFGTSYDGYTVLHPNPKLVGSYRLDVQDKTGRYYNRDLIEAARAGGGFTSYFRSIPGEDPEEIFEKLSYSKGFEPWQMLLGTGAYVIDIERMLASEMRRMSLAGAGAVAFLMILALIIGRSITGPLGRVRHALDAVAADDTEIEIPYTRYMTQAGRLAKSTLALQNKVRERIELEQQQARDRAELDAERQRNAEFQKSEAERQAHVVATIRSALEAVANGDLTVRCADLGEQDAALRDHFNTAISKLETAMSEVTIKGSDIASSKDEIRRASTELSRRTERQAANLEETSAALEQLSEAVRQTAEGARDAATRVVSVSQETETSDAIVNDAVKAMSQIEESSTQISNIIGVIEDIAFQTNLLALNAGVEAARAGESGKGFAVVAQEVRELAQRSSAAAKDVKDQIAGSSAHVENGVRLVGNTGEALKRIFTQIIAARDIVTNIAESASEQDTTLRSLTSAMNDMDATTQQNAAMAEETTASTEALANDTDQLLALIHRFRVSGGGGDMSYDMRMAG